MRVLMRVPRVIQEAGRQRPLDAGVAYDLPAVLADVFVASGVATVVVELEEAAVVEGAPERKDIAPVAPGRKRAS